MDLQTWVRRSRACNALCKVGDHDQKGSPKETPPGLTAEKGWGNNSDRTVGAKGPEKETGKPDEKGNGKPAEQGNGQGQPKGQAAHGKGKQDPCTDEAEGEDGTAAGAERGGNGKGLALGHLKQATHAQLKLEQSTTRYLYDGLGLNVLKEYKDRTAPKAEYYYAGGQVLGRKMFGLKDPLVEREPGLANGGTYFYLTNGLGSVTDLTDHQGEVVQKYRYDAFGGLFTGVIGPYNTFGLTGKAYDAAAGLMDYSARWYDPLVGRFTQADTFPGWLDQPMSQHRYAYVHNNPVNLIDPTGHATGPEGEYTYQEGGPWSLISRDYQQWDTVTGDSRTVATATISTWQGWLYQLLNGELTGESTQIERTYTYWIIDYYSYLDGAWVWQGQEAHGSYGPEGVGEDEGESPAERRRRLLEAAEKMQEAGGVPPVSVEDLPPGTGVVLYDVAAGDTLWDIAEKHLGDGSRYQELAGLSGVVNPDVIRAGHTLLIPTPLLVLDRPGQGTSSDITQDTHEVPPPISEAIRPQGLQGKCAGVSKGLCQLRTYARRLFSECWQHHCRRR